MKLFLFSNYFPYKNSEPFLSNEYQVMEKYYTGINTFSLYGNKNERLHNPESLTESTFILNSKSKPLLFFTGIFNLAPFHFHLADFFRKRIFLYPSKAYWWLVSLLITRSILSHRKIKKLKSELKHLPRSVFYFYWGENFTWIIPYLDLKKHVVVVRLHGSDLYEHLKANDAPLRATIFKKATTILTVSVTGKNYLEKKYPANAHKIRVSRLGVFDHGLNPENSSGEIIAVSVSNIIPLKRVTEIFNFLNTLNLKIYWHHFGAGTGMEELKKISSKKSDFLQLTLHGAIPNEEVIRFYQTQHVDVFLNFSTTEGIPVSIMEAMSFGIPVIATDVGGVHEIVNSGNGSLVNAELNFDEIKKEFERIIRPDLKNAMRLRARKTYEELYSPSNFYELHEGLIKV